MAEEAIGIAGPRVRYLYEETDFASTILDRLSAYAVIVADYDGNIIAFNAGARRLFGYELEEVIGKISFSSLFPQGFIDSGGLQRVIDELLKNGHVSFRGEHCDAQGGNFTVQGSLFQIRDRQGRTVGFVEISQGMSVSQREFLDLEQYVRAPVGVTQHMFGQQPLKEYDPDLFSQIIDEYRSLLEQSIDRELFRGMQADITGGLRELAEHLGELGAGPRDIIDIHTSAIRMGHSSENSMPERAYVEVGRLLLLELMGYMVAYYRLRYTGGSSRPAASTLSIGV